ncbi:MAG: response regulator [Mucilaginibacter sp.]|nr:response regulator [Mucilaginibacter sp.]
MKANILIVEDQFIEANNLKFILKKAGYFVCSIARSVSEALRIIEKENPDLVLLDIQLQGNLTGIDLARILKDKNIAFVFLSANSNKQILDAAKSTKPYGFLVKPFREKDVLVMLDVAWYLHQQNQESIRNKQNELLTKAATSDQFQNIIGQSKNFLDVLDNVRIVGPSETSVLILGESGTGKELIAQAIHHISPRKSKPIIVVNCAALPPNLIESELFGHEKGSFTGSLDKRIGKFEQADGGTVFLDEIGELPLDLQVKFLRVLQEKEIEPIGGKKSKINIRVIAATNRNLEEEMAAGRFRMDLYYRLNVFPISLPPLRERKEDIISLANYFLSIYAHKENKTITGLSDHVIKAMVDYSWPGNIRELENLMERSVLLANGRIINFLQLPVNQKKDVPIDIKGRLKTMTENERDHILAVLEKCNWKIHGQGGAAEILDMNASTLTSRMKKLGIEKKIIPKNNN